MTLNELVAKNKETIFYIYDVEEDKTFEVDIDDVVPNYGRGTFREVWGGVKMRPMSRFEKLLFSRILDIGPYKAEFISENVFSGTTKVFY